MLSAELRQDLIAQITRPGHFEAEQDEAERLALAVRYVDTADASTPSPVWWFDPDFYALHRAGRPSAHPNAYLDYLISGRADGLYPSAAVLDAEAKTLAACKLFDAKAHATRHNLSGSRHDLAAHALRTPGASPIAGLDKAFVERTYPQALAQAHNSLTFVAENLGQGWLYLGPVKAMQDVEALSGSPLFDEAYYRENHFGVATDGSARLHYLTIGAPLGYDPSPRFSTRGYVVDHPEIKTGALNPLLHAIHTGRHWGAAHKAAPGDAGRYDPKLPTVLLCVHEFSRTGAPIVGLHLAEQLSKFANLVVWTLNDGELHRDFAAYACKVVVSSADLHEARTVASSIVARYAPSYAICNALPTAAQLFALFELDVPAVTLVHEFAGYVRPIGRTCAIMACSAAVITPSALIERNLVAEARGVGLSQPTHMTVRPQGAAPAAAGRADEEGRAAIFHALTGKDLQGPLVFGAGSVQPRKGVDVFLQIARRVLIEHGRKATFLWVGDGYSPTDTRNGFWLRDQLERSGLTERVHFVPAIPSLNPLWESGDVFLMSSRLDPYPNVVLDAVRNGLPVVLFDQATGCADLAADPACDVHPVPYLDAAAAASTVVELLDRGLRPRTAEEAARIDERLDPAAYAAAVNAAGQAAVAKAATVRAKAAQLDDRDFEPAHFLASLPPGVGQSFGRPGARALRRLYVAMAEAGMVGGSPAPGRITQAGSQVGAPDHAVVAFHPRVAPNRAPGLAAQILHIHAARAWWIDRRTALLNEPAQSILRTYKAGDPPIRGEGLKTGEEVSPLRALVLAMAGAALAADSLVCHIHDAGTDVAQPAILLGGDWARRQAAALFARNPDIGLVFAEAWRTPAAEPAPPYLGQPVDGVEPMFWARASVIESFLARAGLAPDHALERLLYDCCAGLGLTVRGAVLAPLGARAGGVS